MVIPKDPDDDEMAPYGWLNGVRPRRHWENAGLLHAFGLGAFSTMFGIKLRFWPGRFEETLATPFILFSVLLLIAAAIVLSIRRRRDGDRRWG